MSIPFPSDLWPLILQAHARVFQAIAPLAQTKMGELVQAVPAPQPRYLFHFIYIVENFNPQHLSANDYQQRDPFDSPQLVADDFAQFNTLGFVAPSGLGTYQITERGYEVQQQRWQILNTLLSEVHLLATNDGTTDFSFNVR